MICYLVRHGKDDETIRGGWSQHPLSEDGVQQIEVVAESFKSDLNLKRIYTSDLCRAMQSSRILADKLNLPIEPRPQFREVNNGCLAGMNNVLAAEKYPGLYWNQLEWEQCYPGGESPKQFYERIRKAWEELSQELIDQEENVILVTHGGVIHVIRAILENRNYNNQEKQHAVSHSEVIILIYTDGAWTEQ